MEVFPLVPKLPFWNGQCDVKLSFTSMSVPKADFETQRKDAGKNKRGLGPNTFELHKNEYDVKFKRKLT